MLDFKLLKALYSINSQSGNEENIRNFIIGYLKTHYTGLKIKVDAKGNLYVTKGKARYYPTVVAHMD